MAAETPRVRVHQETFSLWEKLIDDDSLKDVVLVSSDGQEILAHSLILSQASDCFKEMLRCTSMKEGQSKRVILPDLSFAEIRIFLRLLYTGHLDPQDWLPATEDGVSSVASAAARAGPVALSAEDEQEDEDLEQALFGSEEEEEKDPACPDESEEPPLDLLLGVAGLAKTYQFDGLVRLVLEALKKRILAEIRSGNVTHFEAALSFAIKVDLTPLRLYCLRLAEDAEWPSPVRQQFEAQKFTPEVQFELLSIWGQPPPQKRKRQGV